MIYLHYDHYVSLGMVCYLTYIYIYIHVGLLRSLHAPKIAAGCLRPSLRSSWQRWPWQSCPSDVSVSFWAPFCSSSQFLGCWWSTGSTRTKTRGESGRCSVRDHGTWDDSLWRTANYMGYIWVIYRLYMGYIWVIYRLYMGYIWVIYGLYMGYIWVIYGLYMGYIWVIYRLYMGYI